MARWYKGDTEVDRSTMETLAELIERFLTDTGMSQREFERRADALGCHISHTQVGLIRKGRHTGRFEPRTLDAIAAVTGHSRERIYAAAGLRAPSRPFADDLPAGVDYLGQDERNALIGVIRVFLKHSDAALPAGELPANVAPLLPDPGPGTPHPALRSVTRYDTDSQPPDVDSPTSRAVARTSGRKPRGGGKAGGRQDR